jgi:phage baseplate assembly protein gpV
MAITLDGTTGITTTNGDVYAEGNILGTVSQTSGVPTGSILEKGSNANGEYVRYADGTQICWNYNAGSLASTSASGSLFRTTTEVTWTFPKVFIVAPVVIASPNITSRFGAVGAVTTTTADFRHFSAVTAAATVDTMVTAIGRWF